MLTELTRVDLSSDPDYSYEEMGPSSLSSPLSSDSAFGDQLTCSVELVSLNYLCNGDWALERVGGKSCKDYRLCFDINFLYNQIPSYWTKNRWSLMTRFLLNYETHVFRWCFNFTFQCNYILFYQNEGKGMWVPSPINMHCKFAVSFHWKGFGRQSSFCCFFFSYEWRKFTCSWNINKTAYIRINYFLLNVWSAMYRIPNLYLPDNEMNYSSNRGQLVEILIHKNQIPVLPKLYIQIKC